MRVNEHSKHRIVRDKNTHYSRLPWYLSFDPMFDCHHVSNVYFSASYSNTHIISRSHRLLLSLSICACAHLRAHFNIITSSSSPHNGNFNSKVLLYILLGIAIKWVYIVCVGRCSHEVHALISTYSALIYYSILSWHIKRQFHRINKGSQPIDTFHRAHLHFSHVYVIFCSAVQFAQIILLYYYCFFFFFRFFVVGFDCTCYQIYWHYTTIKRNVSGSDGNNSRQVVMQKANKRKEPAQLNSMIKSEWTRK